MQKRFQRANQEEDGTGNGGSQYSSRLRWANLGSTVVVLSHWMGSAATRLADHDVETVGFDWEHSEVLQRGLFVQHGVNTKESGR